MARDLSHKPFGSPMLLSITERLESIMAKERKINSNPDLYAAQVYHQCGIPTKFFTTLLVIARTSGWTAHIMEQRNKNRIIRPTSKYIGPAPTKFVPINERARL